MRKIRLFVNESANVINDVKTFADLRERYKYYYYALLELLPDWYKEFKHKEYQLPVTVFEYKGITFMAHKPPYVGVTVVFAFYADTIYRFALVETGIPAEEFVNYIIEKMKISEQYFDNPNDLLIQNGFMWWMFIRMTDGCSRLNYYEKARQSANRSDVTINTASYHEESGWIWKFPPSDNAEYGIQSVNKREHHDNYIIINDKVFVGIKSDANGIMTEISTRGGDRIGKWSSNPYGQKKKIEDMRITVDQFTEYFLKRVELTSKYYTDAIDIICQCGFE